MERNERIHMGWRQEEDALLFAEVQAARANGRPLKAVFDAVARQTNRRPNSIRNYYYARIKTDARLAPAAESAAFVPFTEAESEALLKTVLTEQAKGVSVRACTLRMGGGDTKAMLRYQNKYRSLIKNEPARVNRIRAELMAAGIPAYDPYAAARTSRAGRPRKRGSLVEVVNSVVSDLDKVEGLDVTAFFESLGALAIAAGGNAKAAAEPSDALHARIRAQEQELRVARERFSALLALYRQLLNVNREFLGMTGVSKMSSLSGYITDLSHNLEACEKLLPEFTESETTPRIAPA